MGCVQQKKGGLLPRGVSDGDRRVKGAEKTVMIDGCSLKCHGRVLNKFVGDDKVTHIDALPFYRKYTDVFLMDDVPKAERKAVARQVADKIIVRLKENASPSSGAVG